MVPEQKNVDWAAVRHDYEHTDKPTAEICREHGISETTLRRRVWRWGWTPRRLPISREGPPPLPVPQVERVPPPSLPIEAAGLFPSAPQRDGAALWAPAGDAAAQSLPATQAVPGEEKHAGNDIPTVERLQGAVVAVLANIEAIVARSGAAGGRTSENERAARALAALTRTLRELNALQTNAAEPEPAHDSDDDIDEFRHALARKIDAFVAAHGGGVRGEAEPEGA